VADEFRARGAALVLVGAAAEAEVIGGVDHREHAAVALRLTLRHEPEVRDLGGDEEHGGRVLAGSDAGTAADALRGVHREVRIDLRHRHRIRVRRRTGARRDVAARLLDLVERRTIRHQIAHHRERVGAEGFDRDDRAVRKAAQVRLAAGHALVRTVRLAVDDQRARAANALAAVVGEGNRLVPGDREAVVYHVEQLEERHVRTHVLRGVIDEAAGLVRASLTPDAEGDGDRFGGACGDHGRRGGDGLYGVGRTGGAYL
jgi:hypothetical protein